MRLLDKYEQNCELYLYNSDMLNHFKDYGFEINNDTKILAAAIDYDINKHPDETVFVTNDLILKNLAGFFFGSDSIISVNENEEDDYKGFIDISLSDEEMSYFYSNLDYNIYDLYINEYLILRNKDNEIVHTLYWDGETHKTVPFREFISLHFGKVKPMKDDVYQTLVADSFYRNQITMIRGKAGSGKTYLSLAYLFSLLEQNKIDKIIVFCNTVATAGSARLGSIIG